MHRLAWFIPLAAIGSAPPLQAQHDHPAPPLRQGDPVQVLLPKLGPGWLDATIHYIGECPMVVVKRDPGNRYVAPNRPKEIRAHSLLALQGLRLRPSGTDSSWVTLSQEELARYGACPTP